MQYDVKSAHVTATGNLTTFRSRLKGIVLTATGTAGSAVFRDGSGGDVLLTIVTPAAADFHGIDVPGEGILFQNGIHVTLTNVGAVTIFHG